MKKKPFITSTALTALSAIPVAADTRTGNLSVTTNIEVSCDAPSPSGTLVLPFDPAVALNNQELASTPVRVTISCDGNPTVNHVIFEDGLHNDIATVDVQPGIRYMVRDGSSGNTSDYLGYKLFAIADTTSSSSDIASNGLDAGTDHATPDNQLAINSTNGNFSITGKIFEENERDNAFGDPTQAATSAAVRGGSYNDTVTLTVDYN